MQLSFNKSSVFFFLAKRNRHLNPLILLILFKLISVSYFNYLFIICSRKLFVYLSVPRNVDADVVANTILLFFVFLIDLSKIKF